MPGGSVASNAGPAGSGAPAPPHVDPATAARAVVTLERHERPMGMGVALAHDGRILTAYSILGDHADVDVRYADGALVRARLQDHDLGWDLALLTPEESPHSQGAPASGRDPTRSTGHLAAFAPAPGRKSVVPTPVTLKGRRTFRGAGDAVLEGAWELATKVSPGQLGSPIVDETGGVIAVVGRGCLPAEDASPGCALSPFGAPMDAIRRFLLHAPVRAPFVRPTLGLQGVAESTGPAKGVRIQVVQSEGPADEAGLRGGEREKANLLVAVDGTPVPTPEALQEVIRPRSVGDRVSLLILREGKYQVVQAVLEAAPPPPTAAPSTSAPATSASAAASAPAPAAGSPPRSRTAEPAR